MEKSNPLYLNEIGNIIHSAKRLAKRYRNLTGRPLGITGEVAEYEAVRLLRLKVAPVRQAGYDAIPKKGTKVERLQIKGRCVLSMKTGQRIGKIDPEKEWGGVILVLLDADYEPTEIYEAQRHEIVEALTKPESKSRNVRGALSISKFKPIGNLVWTRRT